MWQTEGLYKLSSKFPLKRPPLSKCCSVPNYSQLMCKTSKLRVLMIIPDLDFCRGVQTLGMFCIISTLFRPLPTSFIQTLSGTKLKDLFNSRPWFCCLCSILPSCVAASQASGSKKEGIFKLVMLSWTGKIRCDSRATTRWDLCPQKLTLSVCEHDFILFIFPSWDLKRNLFFNNSVSLQVILVFLNFLPKPK